MARQTRAASLSRFLLLSAMLLLPTASLIPLGGLYLWENNLVLWWAVAALAVVALVVLAQRRLLGRGVHTAADPDPLAGLQAAPADDASDPSQPDPTWTARERRAWSRVQAVAARIEPDQLTDWPDVMALARRTVEVVAAELYPEKRDAVWRFTAPEALAMSEQVSRRLSRFVLVNVPFGDRLTVAQILGVYRWRSVIDIAERAYDAWRLLRLANPVTAATNEARDRLSRAFLDWGRAHVTRRLAESFVDEVGRAAIDLYGGRLRVPLEVSPGAERWPAVDLSALVFACGPVRVVVHGPDREVSTRVATELRAALAADVSQHVRATSIGGPSEAMTIVASAEEGMPMPDTPKLIADRVSEADVLVWLAASDVELEQARAAVPAIGAAARAQDRLPPVIVPVRLAAAGAAGPDARGELIDVPDFHGLIEPTVALRASLEAESVEPLLATLYRVLPLAFRVRWTRQSGRVPKPGSERGLARKAMAGIGALGRMLSRRRRKPQ